MDSSILIGLIHHWLHKLRCGMWYEYRTDSDEYNKHSSRCCSLLSYTDSKRLRWCSLHSRCYSQSNPGRLGSSADNLQRTANQCRSELNCSRNDLYMDSG